MRGGIILATTKIWKVVKRLDHVVNYAKDNKIERAATAPSATA